MKEMVFKVSKEGRSARTGLDNDLIINGENNYPKIRLDGKPGHFGAIKNTIGDISTGDHLVKRIPHKYGRIPMVLIHFDHPRYENGDHVNEERSGVLPFRSIAAGMIMYEWFVRTNKRNVDIWFRLNFSHSNFPEGEELFLNYYIFAEAGFPSS